MSKSHHDKIVERFIKAIKANSYALSLQKVRRLLAEGLDPSVRTFDGYSPLHQAASTGDPQICRLFLERGADVYAKDKYGSTPLHFAATGSRVEPCKILIAAGADVHALDSSFETPMHAAAKYSFEIFLEMLAAGGDPGFTPENPPSDYLTPFQAAIKSGMSDVALQVVRYAIEHCGQSLDQLTRDGQTLADLAGNHVALRMMLHSMKTEDVVQAALTLDEAVHAPRSKSPGLTL